MTAYFSVQIKDLEGVYTSKDYWYAFATIMTVSVAGLFFFAKALMWVTETLDRQVKAVGKKVRRAVVRKGRGKKGAANGQGGKDGSESEDSD